MEERLYTSEEAAAALYVSPETIRRWAKSGQINAKHIGIRKVVRIDEEELRRFAKENQILFRPKA
jgi:excisionase family DNA binding protein